MPATCTTCNAMRVLPDHEARETHVFCSYWVEVMHEFDGCEKHQPQKLSHVINQNQLLKYKTLNDGTYLKECRKEVRFA